MNDIKNLLLSFVGYLMITTLACFLTNYVLGEQLSQNFKIMGVLAALALVVRSTAISYQTRRLEEELDKNLKNKITEIICFGSVSSNTKVEINYPYGFSDTIIGRSGDILVMIFFAVLFF